MADVNVTNAPVLGVSIDNYDDLSKNLKILHANLTLVVGESFKTFDLHSGEIKEAYLWGCAELANDCLKLIEVNG